MSAAELKEVEETAIAKASQDSVSIYGQVQSLTVTDQQSYNLMVDLNKAAREIEKAVHAAHDPVCDHWNKMHKDATAARDRDLGKVVEAKRLSKSKYDAWEMEQERIRLAEERRLQEEARRKAEEEARIAREAAEAERKLLAAIEEEERLRLAQEAEQSGATKEQVTEILEAPLYVPEPEPIIAAPVVMPTVAPTFQKAAGVAARWNYSAIGVNILETIRAAAANPAAYAECLTWNQKAINGKATSQKDAFNVPGCKLDKRRV